jgi:hypothetical protein
MVLDDTLTNRQADTGAWILLPMETFEYVEDALCICGWKTETVIPNLEDPPLVSRLGGDVHPRRLLRPAILDRVADQILE